MADIKEKEVTVAQKSITYYNEIAPQYDAMLEKESANSIVRKAVAESFIASVKKGWVLDLGGGTGQDLHWLSNNGYSVIFCEPSAGMRTIAVQNAAPLSKASITFLNDRDTDYTNWKTALPFDQKTEGILLNFAVLNCIPDIGTLFKQLALVIKPGGSIVALILTTDIKTAAKQLLLNTSTSFTVQHHDKEQTVYRHSKRDIRNAAASYFSIKHWEIKKGSGFTLLHLIKT